MERIVPEFIRRRFVIQKEKIKPNERTLNPFKKLSTIETGDLSSAAISKALNPELVRYDEQSIKYINIDTLILKL